MKVCVAGATGVLGRRVVNELTSNGHTVLGLIKDSERANIVRKHGGQPQQVDIFDRISLHRTIEDTDAIIQAATQMPIKSPTTAADWRANDRVRLSATRNLLSIAANLDIQQFIFPSVVWVARHPEGDPINETTPRNPDRTTASAATCETLVEEHAERHDFTPTILRFGWFYGPHSDQTKLLAKQLLSGDLSVVGTGLTGRGDTTIAPIHTADAAHAVVTALRTRSEGVYHVVDNLNVTTATFFQTFARRLDAPSPDRVPAWLAKHVIGFDMVRFLTSDYPTSAARFKQAAGWEPRYPTVSEGLEAVVRKWLDMRLLRHSPDGYTWRDEVSSHYQCRNCGRIFRPLYRQCPYCHSPNRTGSPLTSFKKVG